MNPKGFILRMNAAQKRKDVDDDYSRDDTRFLLHTEHDWGFFWSEDGSMYCAFKKDGTWIDSYQDDFYNDEQLGDILEQDPETSGSIYNSFEAFVAAQIEAFSLGRYWDAPEPNKHDFASPEEMIAEVNRRLGEDGYRTRFAVTTTMAWGFLYQHIEPDEDPMPWGAILKGELSSNPEEIYTDVDMDVADNPGVKHLLEWAEKFPDKWPRIYNSTFEIHKIKIAEELKPTLDDFGRYLYNLFGKGDWND